LKICEPHIREYAPPFEKELTMGYSTLDTRGLIKVVSIMNFLQDTASEHAHQLGVSGFDLNRQNLAWVIYRYHIEIHSYPRWLETVAVSTHRCAWKNLYEVRKIHMEEKGKKNPFINATTAWVMVNKKNQRPVRLDRYLPREMVAHCLTRDPFPPPPTPLERVDFELLFNVRMHDLDLNNHVNNAIYVEWAVETLPREILEKFRPATIDVIFQKQAFYGDPIVSRTQITFQADLPITVHTITKKADQAILATLNVTWKHQSDDETSQQY